MLCYWLQFQITIFKITSLVNAYSVTKFLFGKILAIIFLLAIHFETCYYQAGINPLYTKNLIVFLWTLKRTGLDLWRRNNPSSLHDKQN